MNRPKSMLQSNLQLFRIRITSVRLRVNSTKYIPNRQSLSPITLQEMITGLNLSSRQQYLWNDTKIPSNIASSKVKLFRAKKKHPEHKYSVTFFESRNKEFISKIHIFEKLKQIKMWQKIKRVHALTASGLL